jgi:hypothetical protein
MEIDTNKQGLITAREKQLNEQRAALDNQNQIVEAVVDMGDGRGPQKMALPRGVVAQLGNQAAGTAPPQPPSPTAAAATGGPSVPGTSAGPPVAGAPMQPSTLPASPPSPRLSGAPVMTPEQEALSKAYGEQAGKIMEAAQKAPDVLGKTQVMRTAAQYFTPGATADQRLAAGRYFADIAPRVGIPVKPELVNMIASGEAINKEGGQLVAELVRSMGSREAYAVWNQVRSFMPSVSMSDGGYQIILNSIEQGARRDGDLGKFQDAWLGSHPSIAGMQDAFNKAYPIETYATRVLPMPVDMAKGNFVPGAVYVNKAGQAAVRTPNGAWQATE